jgi:hypothetical protein
VKTTFIYGLIDPRDNQCRYVGKADNPQARLLQHLCADYNDQKRQWIKELQAAALLPELSILAEVSNDEWGIQEKHWIQKMKADGCNLLNISCGGGSQSSRARMTTMMKLKNPVKCRTMLARARDWITAEEIAIGLKSTGADICAQSVRKALNGKPVSPKIIRILAGALGKKMGDIGTFA